MSQKLAARSSLLVIDVLIPLVLIITITPSTSSSCRGESDSMDTKTLTDIIEGWATIVSLGAAGPVLCLEDCLYEGVSAVVSRSNSLAAR